MFYRPVPDLGGARSCGTRAGISLDSSRHPLPVASAIEPSWLAAKKPLGIPAEMWRLIRMKKSQVPDYPLGFVSGASEVWDDYFEEAALLGVFTMMWNRHELRLKELFVDLLAPHQSFGLAVWENANTHAGKMKLFAQAVAHMPVTERGKMILQEITDETARLSDRRNALIHAEYVIHRETLDIAARTNRKDKPPVYVPATADELRKVIADLDRVAGLVSHATVALMDPGLLSDLVESIRKVADVVRDRNNET